MSIDCDGRDSPDNLGIGLISQLAEDCPDMEEKTTEDSPPSYTEAIRTQQQNKSIWTTPISSHSKLPTTMTSSANKNQNKSPSSSISKKSSVKKSSHSSHFFDTDELSLSNTEPKRPLSMTFNPDFTQSTPVKRVYKNWNPPMLGTLPDDFLRLTVTPVKSSSNLLMQNASPARTFSSSMASQSFDDSGIILDKTPRSHSKSEKSSKSSSERRKISRSLTEHSNNEKIRLSRSNTERTPVLHNLAAISHHGSSHSNTRGLTKSLIISSHEFSRDMLDEKMKENERRRRKAVKNVDPEMSQYLEDERLAIMLQNSEFLQELRGNEDFMKTLERVTEGYGDDRQDHLDAFPFSQPAPAAKKDEDAELRRQLKNMGGASRKQFAALAKKFFSRRRKKMSLKQIQKEKLAPSMVNLLDSDEEDFNADTHLHNEQYDQSTTIEPLPLPIQSVPSHKTVQRPMYHPEGIVTYHDNRASDMICYFSSNV
ncbi:hypothetical protein KUTeg_010419 [Tegillarca granosa]|uniref:Uncharacterized protein n=1 Tax=Tegillarca granosa TaxID=220873 RepID=A0ABQ9FA05_TEGGR|nr:hypothetical protein KUTeg_010419 [Tegillarca granosa]